MKIHKIKSWRHFFAAIVDGKKKHDLRKDDRGYNIGDFLILQEYDNVSGQYTGREATCVISYITDNRYPCAYSSAVLPHGYCILSLDKVELSEKQQWSVCNNKIPFFTEESRFVDYGKTVAPQ